MAQFVVANNVNTQLAAALPSSGAGSTTAVLASSANLPTLNTSIGQMMPLTLNDAATGAIYETMYVTAISGATLTVLRGQEGTSALNWNVGDYAFCGPTAGTAGLSTMRAQYQASAAYSSSQALTAAIAGESIGFTGTSAATFSMPSQSTVPTLTPTAIYNDGTAALTLGANGTDKFVVATGQVTSIVMQPGDDLAFYASTTVGLWTAASGSALRQYEPLVVGGAAAPNHAAQLGQAQAMFSPLLGGTLRMLAVAAPNATTVAFSDNYVIVSTAAGQTYRVPLGAALNLATTGVIGGMDIGTATAGAIVAIYAAFNPALFATEMAGGATAAAAYAASVGVFGTIEGSSAAPMIYGGANAPAGYTATALIAAPKISATAGQFVGFALRGRFHAIYSALEISASGSTTIVPLALQNVPYCAIKYRTSVNIGSTGASGSGNLQLYANINSYGMAGTAVSIGSAFGMVTDQEVDIIVPKTTYYSAAYSGAGTPAYSFSTVGYYI